MMRKLKGIRSAVLGLSWLLCAGVTQVSAQNALNVSPARTEIQRGDAALKEKDYATAIAAFRKAIELDPTLTEAHSKFRSASTAAEQKQRSATAQEFSDARRKFDAASNALQEKEKELEKQYQGWAKQNPNVAAYQWALGQLNSDNDAQAERFYLNAIKLDPKFGPAYQDLALIEDFRGDARKRVEYLKKATESDPGNPDYFFSYAYALNYQNPELYRKLAIEVADRFPQHERGAQSLYWLAFYSTDDTAKLAYLERLKTAFPPAKFNWSASAMQSLFEVYAKANPEKALAHAEEMLKLFTSGQQQKTWQSLVTFQQNVVQAQKLISEKKNAEASALLDQTQTSRYMNLTGFNLLKAEAADGKGDTSGAYSVLTKLVANEPNEALQEAATKLGAKLKKSPSQVESDIWLSRDEKAAIAKGFTLTRYTDGKSVSLSDYRGRVVLLNFWYPKCGPCRGEAPYLQNVLKKYGPDKFVILAVNVHPEEDDFVMPYINNNGYGFVPLKGASEFAEKEYKAFGYPANYLIDKDGRIVFKPGVVRGKEGQRTFELQVEALLSHNGETR